MGKRQVKIINFVSHIDQRGELVSTDRKLPFTPQNVFWVYGNDYPRGGHGHKHTDQILVCLKSQVDVWIDGVQFMLSSSRYGLFVPTKRQIDLHFKPGAILLVLASERYDPDDFI